MKQFFRSRAHRTVLPTRLSQARAGQVMPMAAILLVAIVLVIGLAVDVGNLLLARRALQSIVDSAAHSGAQQVDLPAFRATGQVRLEPAAATAAAEAVLVAEGLSDAEVAVSPGQIEVRARASVSLGILSIVNPSVEAYASAAPRGRATP